MCHENYTLTLTQIMCLKHKKCNQNVQHLVLQKKCAVCQWAVVTNTMGMLYKPTVGARYWVSVTKTMGMLSRPLHLQHATTHTMVHGETA